MRAPLRRNRHDNPVNRVSVALSPESHQSRPSPGIRCATTLLAAFSSIRKESSQIPFLGRPGTLPRVRQLCAKGQKRRSHPRRRRCRVERPVINPPNANGPVGTRSSSISVPGPRRHTLSGTLSITLSGTLSETLQLQVRHNVCERENASLLATRERREHRKWQRNGTLLTGSTRMIQP